MKRNLLLGAIALLGSAGCVAHSAIVSTDKQAFVLAGSIFGTNLYHCTAADGQPTCTQVTER